MSSRTQHWQRWDVLDDSDDLVYFTESWDPVDVEELVKTLRADGVVSTLRDAYTHVASAQVKYLYYGHVDGEVVPTICGHDGSTESGDFVDETVAAVFVYLSE